MASTEVLNLHRGVLAKQEVFQYGIFSVVLSFAIRVADKHTGTIVTVKVTFIFSQIICLGLVFHLVDDVLVAC